MCSSGAPYAWHDYHIYLSLATVRLQDLIGGDGTTIESAL